MNLTGDQAQGENKHLFNERANVGLHAVLRGSSRDMRSGRQCHSQGVSSSSQHPWKPGLSAGTSWECWGLASPIWAGTRDWTMPPMSVCKLRLHHLFSFCFCFWRIIEDLPWRAVQVSPELSGYAPAETNSLSWAFRVTAQPQQSRMETFPLPGSSPWGAECSQVVPTLSFLMNGSSCLFPPLPISYTFPVLPLQDCAPVQ